MPSSPIDVYDQYMEPQEQSLGISQYNRSPLVYENVLWCGTAAIPDDDTYRLELRNTGQAPLFNLDMFPNPATVVAFLLNDDAAYISSIVGHPDRQIFFAVKATASADIKVFKYQRPQSPEVGVAPVVPSLLVDDAPSIPATLPLLGILKDELVAAYDSVIRLRSQAGVWSVASVPAATSFLVKGIHTFYDKIYFFVDADYAGTDKAEVWVWEGNGGAITLDQSNTGATEAHWNAEYTCGGIFAGSLYGSWIADGTTNTLSARDISSWSDPAEVQVGKIAEFRGEIYGTWDGQLLSPGSDPAADWNVVSEDFPADLVVF